MVLPQLFRSRARLGGWFRPAKPILDIPVELDSPSDFINNLHQAFSHKGTQVYLDTSFLMWLTKIGGTSRRQFFDWIESACPNRISVPIWAAHEYLRHHTSRTITNELNTRLSELGRVVGSTYQYLRPFMDEALRTQHKSLEEQQASIRRALNEVHELATDAKKWQRHYDKHADEVIAFVNAYAPMRTELYDLLPELASVSQHRYDGRIPPGFQDRSKSGKNGKVNNKYDADEEVAIGSNRWGDLVFWKETLTLARSARAKQIVILTNDNKNDWQYGGRAGPADKELTQIKKSWRPLPLAHPILNLEARVEAAVEQVHLVDSVYLGVYLKHFEANHASAFIDVAIVPDPPELQPESGRASRTKEQEEPVAATAPNLPVYLFSDAPNLSLNKPILKRDWVKSKDGSSTTVADLLLRLEVMTSNGTNVVDVLAENPFGGFSALDLICFSRALHEDLLAGKGASNVIVTDLISALDRIPPHTAGCLYMGLLGAMYFDAGTNRPRLPPTSPCQELLFELSEREFALNSVNVLGTILRRSQKVPLYVPGQNEDLEFVLKHVPEADGLFQLGSIQINGIEIYSSTQIRPSLNLINLNGGDNQVTVDSLIDITSSILAIRPGLLKYKGNKTLQYFLISTAGFVDPTHIHRNEENNDE